MSFVLCCFGHILQRSRAAFVIDIAHCARIWRNSLLLLLINFRKIQEMSLPYISMNYLRTKDIFQNAYLLTAFQSFDQKVNSYNLALQSQKRKIGPNKRIHLSLQGTGVFF